jgi:hypothetical protein
MKIIIEDMTLSNFQAWSGAFNTRAIILANDKQQEFEEWIDEMYPDGLTDTQLNDILWFEPEIIGDSLDIKELKEEE